MVELCSVNNAQKYLSCGDTTDALLWDCVGDVVKIFHHCLVNNVHQEKKTCCANLQGPKTPDPFMSYSIHAVV